MASNKRRRFGNVRKLPSGRYQARYYDPDGIRRAAPDSFETEGEALDWLTVKEAELLRGEWTDPDRGKVPFGPYARAWIDERSGLRPRTIELYRSLLRRFIEPTFGNVDLVTIDPARVRRWRHGLLTSGVPPTQVAKAYRLLRAILMTAVDDDELISRNPCRIRGGGSESPGERLALTVAQVLVLADEMPARFRALVLVAAFGSLRYGEVMALERRDIDLEALTIRVRQAYTQVTGRGFVLGPPKSKAGRRTVSIPAAIVPDLRDHLARYVGPAPNAHVFTGPKGAVIARGNFNKLVGWEDAVAAIGVPGLHFHDLRHTGNTLAADAGVSLRDLMGRMGHDSMKAALIYQHGNGTAERTIAQTLDEKVRAERTKRQRRRRDTGS